MEIKINEYVRTKNGIIAKLEFITEFNDYFFDRTMYQKYSDTIEFLQEYELEEYITKHSFDIIDLIEEGDYVNSKEITIVIPADICGDEKLEEARIFVKGNERIYPEQIKSIVTKEQFESIEYKVGD